MIKDTVAALMRTLPKDITVVAASKKRSVQEILQAYGAGICIFGENYVQEAQQKSEFIDKPISWHCIGKLQTNKVKIAVKIFDMIQTLDSLKLAECIDKEAGKIDKIMPVLIEVNSGEEPNKAGVMPDELLAFIPKLFPFKNIKAMGLMTMGPNLDEKDLRPYFQKTGKLFNEAKHTYKERLNFRYLSMGMSTSYTIAVEEGANMIRLGTCLFGPRK